MFVNVKTIMVIPAAVATSEWVMAAAVVVVAMITSDSSTKEKKCLPCNPAVGTILYRIDTVPPSKPHYPYCGTHTHRSMVHQSPYPICECHVNKLDVVDGAVPIQLPDTITVTGGGPAMF